MITPNTQCLLCAKPLYRRVSDMAKHRYAACMACRSEAQKVSGITEKQLSGLSLGRVKGTNHLNGTKRSELTKLKMAASRKRWCELNPERIKVSSEKIRGRNNYNWKGGVSPLNQSIRRMTENRKWMDGVKSRDGRCMKCGNCENLESHHDPSLATLITMLGIKSMDDARARTLDLWKLSDGITLCSKCHYAEHGRIGTPTTPRVAYWRQCIECGIQFVIRPSRIRVGEGKFCSAKCHGVWRSKHYIGKANQNWKGGKVTVLCRKCKTDIAIKPCRINPRGHYCSMECRYAH